jgi:hypothetical protein
MEVHHHSHKPKKVSEYFTEFIMLFAAVTLGFFAENYREHQIEKHREIQYLKNIHLDLERDIVEIDRIYNLNIEYQQLGNEFIQLYDRGYQTDLPRFYYLTKTLALKTYFQRSKNGIDQLKNAGGLRLVENDEIIKRIQQIDIRVANIEMLQENIFQNLIHYRLKLGNILDAYTTWEMNEIQKRDYTEAGQKNNYLKNAFEIPKQVRPLKNNSPEAINEVVFLASGTSNLSRYMKGNLVQLKNECVELNKILIKTYGSEF